jgi:phosphoribosylanthranilate isomerase
MVYVKVCGLTSVQDARVAIDAGADAIGMVMSVGSPRHLTVQAAAQLTDAVRDAADTVLVVAGLPAAEAAAVAERLGVHVLQLHGPAYTRADFDTARTRVGRVWRAIALADDLDQEAGTWGEELLILDAPQPGSGVRWDLSQLESRRPAGRWLLAGGLSPDNVAAAIATARPFGVDVSSGVESSPGVKDRDKIRAFVAQARGARIAVNRWGTNESSPYAAQLSGIRTRGQAPT